MLSQLYKLKGEHYSYKIVRGGTHLVLLVSILGSCRLVLLPGLKPERHYLILHCLWVNQMVRRKPDL